MADHDSNAGDSGSTDTPLTDSGGARTREVVVVRRRRSTRYRSRNWQARLSPKRARRVAVVCGGVLLLMATGLYFGLAWQ